MTDNENDANVNDINEKRLTRALSRDVDSLQFFFPIVFQWKKEKMVGETLTIE